MSEIPGRAHLAAGRSYTLTVLASSVRLGTMAAMPNGTGYWLAWSTGAVGAYGDAARYGSMYDLRLDDPVVGIVSTPDATGYWLVAATAAGEGYRLVTSWP